MIESRGALVPTGPAYGQYGWTGSRLSYGGTVHVGDINLTHLFRRLSYAEMFRRHPAVFTVVDKRGDLVARLPLKVYRPADAGRELVRGSAYARLLSNPNPAMSAFEFKKRVSVHRDLYGEAIIVKVRDAAGVPVELWPVDPFAVELEWSAGALEYVVVGVDEAVRVAASDVVHWRRVDPENPWRGLSPLEPLRATLDNTEQARTAMASFWARGARPGVALVHPGTLSDQAAGRLKAQFDSIAAGAGKRGVTVVLEEGMRPEVLSLSAEEAQYLAGRKYDDREVFAAYQMPPTAVGDLEYATYSNVTENLRSVYRDTITPVVQSLESAFAHQLAPDFGGDEYAEFLLDEVLRGDFEQRAAAYQQAINAGWMTPAEVRALENLPFEPGSDKLVINSTMRPVSTDEDDRAVAAAFAADVGLAVQRLGLGVSYGVLSPDEARELLPGVAGPAPALPSADEERAAVERLAASWRSSVRAVVDKLEARGKREQSLLTFRQRGVQVMRDRLELWLAQVGADAEQIDDIAERAWSALEADLAAGATPAAHLDEWLSSGVAWATEVLAELEHEGGAP